jgi:hypothetical protein
MNLQTVEHVAGIDGKSRSEFARPKCTNIGKKDDSSREIILWVEIIVYFSRETKRRKCRT